MHRRPLMCEACGAEVLGELRLAEHKAQCATIIAPPQPPQCRCFEGHCNTHEGDE